LTYPARKPGKQEEAYQNFVVASDRTVLSYLEESFRPNRNKPKAFDIHCTEVVVIDLKF
jgi:hypothetical protein